MQALQAAVKKWHSARFGRDPDYALGNKLAEEAGEVCRAIDRMGHAKTQDVHRGALVNLREEVGDAGLVLVAICARKGWDFQAVLTDRAGAKGMLE